MRKSYFLPATISLVVLVLALSVGIPYLAKSFSGGSPQTVIENVENFNQSIVPSPTAVLGGVTPDNEFFKGDATVDGTFSTQYSTRGNKFIRSLSFARGVTTTPGAVLSLPPPAKAQICRRAVVNISSGSGATNGGSVTLKVATSTVNNDFPFYVGTVGLIPTTTVASNTAPTISNSNTTGTGRDWFPWLTTEYVNVAIEAGFYSDQVNTIATSTTYSELVGKLYMDCQDR